ncbi:carboxymuconolactone decarboxylase family protein [soil metagenome]
MVSSPRVEPTTEADWDDETRAVLDQVGRLNIFTTLAHHPKLLKRWLVFGGHVLAKTTLPARERELAILRVGWRCHSVYEFGQHTLIGGLAGLTQDEIRRLTTPLADASDGWSPIDATLLNAVDELVDDYRISDTTWAALESDGSTQQIMDLVFAVGQYVLTCMALNSFGVQLDDGVPGWPDGVEPEDGWPEDAAS